MTFELVGLFIIFAFKITCLLFGLIAGHPDNMKYFWHGFLSASLIFATLWFMLKLDYQKFITFFRR